MCPACWASRSEIAFQLGAQVVSDLISAMRKEAPSVPERFWTELRASVRTDELLEQIAPVYARSLSSEEVKALIAFYESAVGKKFVALQPSPTKESISVSERWSRSLADRAIARLKAEAAKQGAGKK